MASSRFDEISKAWLFFWGTILVIAALLPHFAGPYRVLSTISIFMYVGLAISWTLFCGPTGYFSLATATFFGIGIYVSALLSKLFPYPLVIICGGLVSLFVGVLVGLICLRLSGFYFAVFTFGLSELTRHSVLWWEHNISGTVGRWIPPASGTKIYYGTLCVVVFTAALAYFIRHSNSGRALRGIGDSEEGAEHIGIDVTKFRICFFAVSCFLMGMMGAAMAPKWTYVDPNSAFNPLLSFTPVLMSLFGGLGKDYGPILGAFVLTLISEVLLSRFPYFYTLIYGVIFIVVILFMPKGVVGIMVRPQQKPTVS